MRLIALAVVLLGSAVLEAQSPPRRAHHALIYDPVRERVLLTGGSTPLNGGQSFAFFNDLWAFDGTGWRWISESGDKISGIRLAWDVPRARVLSFGGYMGRPVGLLRTLDGDQWSTLGDQSEGAAAEPGFVFDLRRNRLVAFGGSAGHGQAQGTTWEYDGGAWSAVAAAGPSARQAHAMIFDEKRGRVVLYGGMGTGPAGQPPPSLGDLWEFDGSTWAVRAALGPEARHSSGAAYDAKRGLLILFGGVGSGGFLGDTWSWDGTAWKKLADSGPEPRAMGYLAYDSKRDRIVLFGGRKGWPDGDLNDTWEWDGVAWRRVGS